MANIPIVLTLKKELEKRAEISWNESETSRYLVSVLGKPYWMKKTALIYKLGNGPSLFFRSELDALNTADGPKHVCGHSSHMAALAAAYLTLQKETLNKTIYFIFQPSEESYPSGAQFISDNFPELSLCKAGFAFHVHKSEKMGEAVDVSMAGADYFEIEITTEATHIKNKNTNNNHDALLLASGLVTAINSHKDTDVIVNIGTIHGGSVPNAIAGNVKMTGDIRARSTKAFQKGREFLKRICSANQSTKLTIVTGYPPLTNDKTIVTQVKKLIPIGIKEETFGTEDFSLYPVPKAFFHIGTGETIELHNPLFRVPDTVAERIVEYWITLARHYLPK